MKVSPFVLLFAIFLGSLLSNFSLFGQTKISLGSESASPLMMLSHTKELAQEETSKQAPQYSTEEAERARFDDTSLMTRDHRAIMQEEESNDPLDEIDLTEPPKSFDRFLEAAQKYPGTGRFVLSSSSEILPQEASPFSRLKQLYRGGNENNRIIFRHLKTALAEYEPEKVASLLSPEEEISILKNGLSASMICEIQKKLKSATYFTSLQEDIHLPSFSDISDIPQEENMSWPDSDTSIGEDTSELSDHS